MSVKHEGQGGQTDRSGNDAEYQNLFGAKAFDREFIDLDPRIRNLKAGYLM